MIVVSLSSIPPRFGGLPRFFQHLARQSLRPDLVELNLPERYRRFPGAVPTLPPLPDWVRVCRVDQDAGPATKILPTLARHAGYDRRLVYCDDDRVYDRDWLARLVAAHGTHPGHAICESGWIIADAVAPADPAIQLGKAAARGAKLLRLASFGLLQRHRRQFRRAGAVHIAEGFGGVLFRADWLDAAVRHPPAVAWPVDDIWLSGALARRGIAIRVSDGARRSNRLMRDNRSALSVAVIDGRARAAQDAACIAHLRETYGIWPIADAGLSDQAAKGALCRVEP